MISLGEKIDQQTFQACLQKIERVNTVYTAPEKVNSSLLLYTDLFVIVFIIIIILIVIIVHQHIFIIPSEKVGYSG